MCDMIWTARLFKCKNRWLEVGQTHRTKHILFSFIYLQTFSNYLAFNLSEYSLKHLQSQSSAVKLTDKRMLFFFLSSRRLSNSPSFACMRVERKSYWRKIQPRSPFADMGQPYFRHQEDFLISGHVQGQDFRGGRGLGKEGSLWDCRRSLVSRALQNWILYSTHNWANHRQTNLIQSRLWRENLINIIRNEMERGEEKGLFSPAGWGSRW